MTVWTEYQGIEVEASDPVVKYRHPRLDKDDTRLSVLKGASLLWLVDQTLLVICDECGYNGITGNEPYVKPEGEQRPIIEQAGSLFSHINGIHRSGEDKRSATVPTFSRYTEAQIKAVLKIWLKWKATRIDHWPQSACDELEQLGFKPRFAEKWTPDQLGSLVRSYLKRDYFKNIKAGPVDAGDKAALAELVRDAAARVRGGRSTVATTARITTKSTKKSGDEAAQSERQEEDVAVVVSEGSEVKLTFTPIGGAGQEPARTLVVGKDDPVEVARGNHVASWEEPEPKESQNTNTVERLTTGDFKLVATLQDGSPMFIYQGVLMVGKVVKDVAI